MSNKISLLCCCFAFLMVSCTPSATPGLEKGVHQKTSFPATATATPPPQELSIYPTFIPVSKGADGCISPLIVSGYPSQGEVVLTSPPKPLILPTGWDSVSMIPENLIGKNGASIILLRPRKGYDEFWIGVFNGPDDEASSNYLIYRTDTKEWSQAPIPPRFDIFLDANNGVWSKIISKDKSVPILYRLDESTNQFVPIMDKTNILNDGYIPSNIKVDANGLFWFILSDNDNKISSLYSFDPKTLEAKLHLTGNYADSIEIDKNDNVYILQYQSDGLTLVRYNPSTGETLSDIPHTDDVYGNLSSMYIDHESRLWISDFVWLDLSLSEIGVPFIIIRSPVFIDYLGYMDRYLWMRPRIILQSIDGRLWYSSTRGDAWFNPTDGQWCLFTTDNSIIFEDSEYNLWMMIDNSLYELRLSP